MDEPKVRVIERWGLVAGVTGVVANVLLIALYVLALGLELESYEWTGPANDVIGGMVSMTAMMPVAFALRDVVGAEPFLRRMTHLAVGSMALIVALSTLLVTDVIPFSVQGAGAGVAILVIFAWVAVVGRAAERAYALPRRLARRAVIIGVSALVGALLIAVSFVLPRESLPQYLVGGAGLLIGLPAYLYFPVWLILLSNRLRAHLGNASL